QVVTYTLTATDNGNTTLHNVSVSDSPSLGGFSCTPSIPVASLAPGASVVCTGTHAITQADLDNGSFTDTASATSNEVNAPNAPDTITATQSPSISIDKTTNGSDGPFIPVGAPITWNYHVHNTGNVTLTNVTVTDDHAAVNIDCDGGTNTLTDNVIASLAPGASVDCTATGVATAGAYTNTGTATGTPPVGADVTATDTSSYFGSDPSISID